MNEIRITKHVVKRFIERYSIKDPSQIVWFIKHMVMNAEKSWSMHDREYRYYGGFVFVCVNETNNGKSYLLVITMLKTNNGFAENSASPENNIDRPTVLYPFSAKTDERLTAVDVFEKAAALLIDYRYRNHEMHFLLEFLVGRREIKFEGFYLCFWISLICVYRYIPGQFAYQADD